MPASTTRSPSQIFGPDALTWLAAAGSQVPGIGLGTGVVPVHPRHPMMLAQQALTVQAATDDRLLLGIGLSHQVVVEGMWGLSYEKPASYMREYLASLMPLLHGEAPRSTGERVTTNAFAPLDIRGTTAPPVLVAALGPAMLELAGTAGRRHHHLDDGHGHRRLAHLASHPTGRGRRGPAGARASSCPCRWRSRPTPMRRGHASTRSSPSTRTCRRTRPCWRRRAHAGPARSPSWATRSVVAESIRALADAGATDFVAAVVGDADQRARGFALLRELARS